MGLHIYAWAVFLSGGLQCDLNPSPERISLPFAANGIDPIAPLSAVNASPIFWLDIEHAFTSVTVSAEVEHLTWGLLGSFYWLVRRRFPRDLACWHWWSRYGSSPPEICLVCTE